MEKPKSAADLERLKVLPEVFRRLGLRTAGKTHLASMGVYLFTAGALEELLARTEYKDFGREVIPGAIRSHKVYAYLFDDYWRDIGTIKSFYEANLDLTLPLPRERPIFTHARYLPGSKILRSEVDHSILREGSIINRSKISHSIIGIRSRVGEGSSIERNVVMGADYFESKEEIAAGLNGGLPPIGIGRECLIRGAIVDKNARIGAGVKLINERGVPDLETDDYVIRDGIIVVPKHAVIPDGTVV